VELGDLVGRIATVLRGATVNVSRPAGSRTENRYVGRGDQMSKLAERHRLRLQTLTEQIRQTAADLPDG
jgi:hypothetical protein